MQKGLPAYLLRDVSSAKLNFNTVQALHAFGFLVEQLEATRVLQTCIVEVLMLLFSLNAGQLRAQEGH